MKSVKQKKRKKKKNIGANHSINRSKQRQNSNSDGRNSTPTNLEQEEDERLAGWSEARLSAHSRVCYRGSLSERMKLSIGRSLSVALNVRRKFYCRGLLSRGNKTLECHFRRRVCTDELHSIENRSRRGAGRAVLKQTYKDTHTPTCIFFTSVPFNFTGLLLWLSGKCLGCFKVGSFPPDYIREIVTRFRNYRGTSKALHCSLINKKKKKRQRGVMRVEASMSVIPARSQFVTMQIYVNRGKNKHSPRERFTISLIDEPSRLTYLSSERPAHIRAISDSNQLRTLYPSCYLDQDKLSLMFQSYLHLRLT